MTDLKNDFYNWLINNKKYKSSTANLYIREINKTCLRCIGKKDNKSWDFLGKNIASILIYYSECQNKEYYISIKNANILQNHFISNILRHLRFSDDLNKSIISDVKLSIIYNATEYSIYNIPLNSINKHIQAFKFILDKITQKDFNVSHLSLLYALAKMENVIDGDLTIFFDQITTIISNNYDANKTCTYLHIQHTFTSQKKTIKALELFYEHIKNINYLPSPHLGIDEIKNIITCINSTHDNIFTLITSKEWSGNSAKQIIKSSIKNGLLYTSEVCDALECSHSSLRKLKKLNKLTPITKNGRFYRIDDVNKLLKNALHMVTYNGVDYNVSNSTNPSSIWCRREQAAKILKCNVSTIDSYKKERLLTYREVVPNSAFFYIKELKKVAKLIKINPRRAKTTLKLHLI